MYRVKAAVSSGGEERRKAQLSSLQVDDKDVEDILLTASHVALYELKTESSGPAWKKTEVEGSLYVLKRRSRPKTMLLIKNHADSDEGDFSQNLEGKVEFELKESTIFYKVGDRPTVRGLWFAHKESLNQFVALLEKNTPAQSDEAGKALMEMLGRSQAAPKIKPATTNTMSVAAVAAPAQPDDDAISLLKEKLRVGAAPLSVRPSVPSAPSAPSAALPDTVTIRKSDLRIVLADLLSSDEIINRVFASLAARNQAA